MPLRRWPLSITIAAGIFTAPTAAVGQAPQIKEVPARAIPSVQGRDSFDAYCAACHGRDAKGQGPAAPALKGPMPDLTTLARRNGGKFDALAVERAIGGSDRNRPAHGSLDMPVWGPVFRTAQSDAAAAVRLANLVKFLESLQQK
jgi:mono/diheme cytochrome c family protein